MPKHATELYSLLPMRLFLFPRFSGTPFGCGGVRVVLFHIRNAGDRTVSTNRSITGANHRHLRHLDTL
jgi:hypothetical protein